MKKCFLIMVWLAGASLLLVNCSPKTPAPATAPGAVNSTAAAASTGAASTGTASAPAAQPTSQPTATPQQGKVLLVAPAGTDAQSAQPVLVELTSGSGLSLETRESIQKEDLGPGIKAVVLLSAPANLADLLAAAPQTQFIVVSGADLQPAANLSVIRQKLENQAFVAGYITALLSTDYRAGGLLPADGPLADKLQEAFTNGAHYYCGVCAPGWPLNLYYPQVAALPAASDGPAWQSALAGLHDNSNVEVYYIAPEAARQEVFDYLQGNTQNDKPVLVVGAQTPPDGLKAQWAATVRFDLSAALRQVWPDVSAGKGGAAIDVPITVESPNPSGPLAGRMRLVKEVIDGLKAGTIYPFSVPLQ